MTSVFFRACASSDCMKPSMASLSDATYSTPLRRCGRSMMVKPIPPTFTGSPYDARCVLDYDAWRSVYELSPNSKEIVSRETVESSDTSLRSVGAKPSV